MSEIFLFFCPHLNMILLHRKQFLSINTKYIFGEKILNYKNTFQPKIKRMKL